jgi:hypothetical protein
VDTLPAQLLLYTGTAIGFAALVVDMLCFFFDNFILDFTLAYGLF